MSDDVRDARFEDGAERPLRLRAFDAEDLAVLSAAAQDGVFPATEMRWSRRERRFAVLLNRFRWEDDGARPERVQSVLAIEEVLSVQSQGVQPGDEVVLSVLNVAFEQDGDGPEGRVILTLAGDGAIAVSGRGPRGGAARRDTPLCRALGHRAVASRLRPQEESAMAQRLSTAAPDFEARFAALLGAKREESVDVDDAAAAIIAEVRARGDAALCALTGRFDRMVVTPGGLRFTAEEIAGYAAQVDAADRAALELAAARIGAYHARQMPQDERWTDEVGAELGWRWTPVAAAGIYVPGGTASYPSSVLMNAIPARVAGVARIAMVVPTPDGVVNPLVMLAAQIAGVTEIYRIGGAQAIAALAYGTESIAPVDKITGPGNAWVAAAKRRVFGRVGIDMIAGPSEILVIADADNEPDWIALDLLSQAEHDVSAQSILITDDAGLADRVEAAVARLLETLPRRAIAAASWRDNGVVIVVRDLDEAARLSDRFAPEHLELCVADPDALALKIRHAGAIFLGAWTPEAIGDYVGGPNHVLPTARSARFSSGLSVLDFLKRTTLARMTPAALAAIGPAAERLAASEGLDAHGQSVTARLVRLNETPRG